MVDAVVVYGWLEEVRVLREPFGKVEGHGGLMGWCRVGEGSGEWVW